MKKLIWVGVIVLFVIVIAPEAFAPIIRGVGPEVVLLTRDSVAATVQHPGR